MAQLDDIVGVRHGYFKDDGLDDDTIVVFMTDNGTETNSLAGRRTNAVLRFQRHGLRGRFSLCPLMVRWPGHVPAGTVENGVISGLDFFPTFVAAAGNPNIKEELLNGKQMPTGPTRFYLDSYNQLDMITGKGPSTRHEIFYFAESALAAVRIDDFKFASISQPADGSATKVASQLADSVNFGSIPSSTLHGPARQWQQGPLLTLLFEYEFWRFVFCNSSDEAPRRIEFPPMQKGASFTSTP